MKVLLFVTCLWHTTLVQKNFNVTREVDLVEQPKIGQKIHINGLIWKVVQTKHVCDRPILPHRAEAQ